MKNKNIVALEKKNTASVQHEAAHITFLYPSPNHTTFV